MTHPNETGVWRLGAAENRPVLPRERVAFQRHEQALQARARALDPDGELSLASCERRAITAALLKADGNKRLAAAILGIGKTTLYRKLREYGVTRASTS